MCLLLCREVGLSAMAGGLLLKGLDRHLRKGEEEESNSKATKAEHRKTQ